MRPIRLHVFDGGSTEIPLRNYRLGYSGDERVAAPTPWYLLEHPRGNVVIDGGNAAAVAEDPVAHWGEIAKSSITTMRPDQAIVPAMRAHGFDTADVRWIVQSHLHLDHTGALAAIEEFPNAEVLVTRTEHAWAHAPASFATWGYCHADFVKPGIPWVLLEDHEDGYDLFGDGTLRMFRTPGHSPGHQSFDVHLPSGTNLFLAIDAINRVEELEGKWYPAFTSSMVEATASIARIRRLAWRSDATVIVGHDPEQWATLRHVPGYYE
jgi:glyoxylase-like metal-dependent hydrolase (beta-lactamase superfamily II)